MLYRPAHASVSFLAVPRGTSIEAPALDETMVKCEECDRLFGESAIAKHSVRDLLVCFVEPHLAKDFSRGV